MKTRTLFLLSLILFSVLNSYCQVTEGEKKLRTQSTDTTQGWKKGGMVAVNLAQTSLTHWAAGGENSIAVNGLASFFANLKRGKNEWFNSVDIGYGILKQGNAAVKKTDDKLEFLSKYGREAFKNVYYAGLVNLRTQMSTGFDYNADPKKKISNLFAPAYLVLALGLDYKPDAYFSAFLAPLTARFTFVADDSLSAHGAFGVTPGKKTRSEMGGYFRAGFSKGDFKSEFLKNVTLSTKIDLFSNYLDKPQNIDVNWETLIGLKVNKYIGVSFNTVLIYDDNVKVPVGDKLVGSLVQFKEILGVGFSYKF